METMRRMGVPVIIKHMYNAEDVANGYAIDGANQDPVYGQTFYNDAITNGVGFASVETSPTEWISPTGSLVVDQPTSPGMGYVNAPKYRGYGPGYLVYAILPDVAEDVWKLTVQGNLFRTQQARVQLPWYPLAGDNDLMIVCQLDPWENVVGTYERFQLKQVQPISMRGADRYGIREFSLPPAGGDRLWVGQYCEANRVRENDTTIYGVETNR
jgi:hypothetical protein